MKIEGACMSCAALVRRLCVYTLLFSSLLCGNAVAQQSTTAVAEDERTAVRRGSDFERDRRWLDAIEYYEKSLETYPESDALKYGLRRSKVHYSVDRRYSDRSFLEQLWPQTRSQALAALDDVLSKIRQHYVDPVSPT